MKKLRIRNILTIRAAVIVLLVTHVILLLAPLRGNFITVDEAMNVAAGVSYWQTGRFFIYRVNPPLTKMIAVLPALACRPKTDWDDLQDIPGLRAEFDAGAVFTELNRSRILDLVCLARLPGIAWSVLCGWLIYRWGRELYGGASGCLALALWCTEPYVLGHAALVTSDIPSAAAGLSASYMFWRYLRAPCLRLAIVTGILLGIASLTKFTLLVLYPLWPFLWAIERWSYRRKSGEGSLGTATTFFYLFLIAFVSLDIINLGYGCLGTCKPLGDYSFTSRLLTGDSGHVIGNRFRRTWLEFIPVPVPADYLCGIDIQRVDFEETRLSYLGGIWSRRGWWYYYIYALAVKLPLGTLVLFLCGLARVLRRSRQIGFLDDLILLAPAFAILILVSSQIGYTQHSRYIIPALPYLMINAGGLVSVVGRQPWGRWLAWGLLFATIISSMRIYPHSLSYFNEAVGGPLRGHDHLIDSNIDWGQDLLRLKHWADEHPEMRPLGLAYYNFQIDPSLAGLDSTPPPPGPESMPNGELFDEAAVGPRPGYYAVSVNFLKGFEFLIHDGRGGFRQSRPHEFEYFRFFQPIGRAGYSIYIYYITADQANAVRRRIGLTPFEFEKEPPRMR